MHFRLHLHSNDHLERMKSVHKWKVNFGRLSEYSVPEITSTIQDDLVIVLLILINRNKKKLFELSVNYIFIKSNF